MKITTRPQTYIKSWVGLIVRRGLILDAPIHDIHRILQEETATIVLLIIQNRPCLKVIMKNRGFHEILPLQIGSPNPTQSPAGSSNRGMNLTLLSCASLRNPICRKESRRDPLESHQSGPEKLRRELPATDRPSEIATSELCDL